MTTARLGTQGWSSAPKVLKPGSPRDLHCRNCKRNQSNHQANTNKTRNTIKQTNPQQNKQRLEGKTNLPSQAQTKQTGFGPMEMPPSQQPGLHQLPQPHRQPTAASVLRAGWQGHLQGAFCSGHREGGEGRAPGSEETWEARPQQAAVMSWATPSSRRIKVSP